MLQLLYFYTYILPDKLKALKLVFAFIKFNKYVEIYEYIN